MSHASTSAATRPELLDPELLALDAPPTWRRTALVVLMALSSAAALAFAWSLRSDVAYFFAPSVATDLGDATSVDPDAVPTNRFVRVRGTPMMSGTVYYTRGFGLFRYAVFPLAGQRNVYVEVELEDGEDASAFVRRELEGRVVHVADLGGRFEAVRRYVAERQGQPIGGRTLLVSADATPSSHAWALVWVALALGIVAVNLGLLVRWFRPLPGLAGEPGEAL